MSKNWWGFEMPSSWVKTQEVISRITLPTEKLGLTGKSMRGSTILVELLLL